MTPLVVAAVLGAALLHATWNAVLRGGADRLHSIVVMCMVSALLAAPFTILLPLPAMASWPYIGLSAALQIGCCLFLVRAYRQGEFGQIYPIARGTSPLLVTLGAALLAGEHLGAVALTGVALVSAGIMALARGADRRHLDAILSAVATGCFIAGYTVTDGIGSRLAGGTGSYVAWMFLVQGAPMPLIYWLLRRRLPLRRLDREVLRAVGGGLFSLLAYGTVVWALAHSPMGQVSALRETSILFAVVIGRLFLGEALTLRRIVSASMIAAGAFCLSVAH